MVWKHVGLPSPPSTRCGAGASRCWLALSDCLFNERRDRFVMVADQAEAPSLTINGLAFGSTLTSEHDREFGANHVPPVAMR
jgi:hypothetical protein